MQPHHLPETGFLRVKQIVGDPKRGIPPLLPIHESTWWAGVRSGKYPKSIRLGRRCTVWRVEEIRKLLESISQEAIAQEGLQ